MQNKNRNRIMRFLHEISQENGFFELIKRPFYHDI